jgi:hypothetical protein
MNAKLNIQMSQSQDVIRYNMNIDPASRKPLMTSNIKVSTLMEQLKDVRKELKQVAKERDELKREVLNNFRIILLSIAILFITLNISIAQQNAPKRTAAFNLEKNVAIQGYDPVAYFKQGKAIKGKKEFAVTVDGVSYYCSTADNKDAFAKSSSTYEPQYGGWCAYAMGAKNEKVEIDPATFKIVGGKLYLFYNAYFNNTLTKWNVDETNLKNKADANWKKIF